MSDNMHLLIYEIQCCRGFSLAVLSCKLSDNLQLSVVSEEKIASALLRLQHLHTELSQPEFV